MSLARAIETGDLAQLPGRRDEDWRWTDLRGLIRAEVEWSPEVTDAIQPGGPFRALKAHEVVIANGRFNWWPGNENLPANLQVASHDAPGAIRMADALPMGRLAAERTFDPPVTILAIDGGTDRQFCVRHVSRAQGTGHHSRLGVVVRAGVSATLLESYEGAGWDYFSNVVTEIFLEEGASLERIVIADDVPNAISISTTEVHLGTSCRFAQTILTTGAKRQRLETRISHPGAGVSVRLDAVYLAGEKRHADLTTVVDHQGPNGSTSQLAKGAVAGQGRAVFQGRILVEKGADGADARMGHHALILSDKAEVDARPELLIHADDVSCAHGNTVGALDEEAMFYARQRGIPEAEARAMLTEAFVGEVVDRIEHEGARNIARAWVAEKLGSLA